MRLQCSVKIKRSRFTGLLLVGFCLVGIVAFLMPSFLMYSASLIVSHRDLFDGNCSSYLDSGASVYKVR